jgi:hypothetical protein
MNKRNLSIWLFIIALIFILIIRDLFRIGMFMDGMIYTSVGKNLANDIGTFWQPHFSKTTMSLYHEQPPLMFGIESIFFRILGDNHHTEHIYGLTVLLLTIFLIHKLWATVLTDQAEKTVSWLPILFWLAIPVCFWSYANNMEEPLMGMFDLASLLFIFKALIQKKKIYLNLALGAIMLVAASMCKGPQGLFPLAAVFFYWAVFQNISFGKMFTYSMVLAGIVVGFYGIILLSEEGSKSYEMYFLNRIYVTFNNPASTHTDRIYIIKQLFSELIPVFVLTVGTFIFLRIKKHISVIPKHIPKTSLLFFLIALSGTLPLLLTIEQSGYYLVTVMPYYAMGFSIYFSPFFSRYTEQVNMQSKLFKRWRIAVSLILICSVSFSIANMFAGPKRDVEKLHDVFYTGEIIQEGNTIGVSSNMFSDWSLQSYYNRYFYISLDTVATQHKYILLEKDADLSLMPKGYSQMNIPTKRYSLFMKK